MEGLKKGIREIFHRKKIYKSGITKRNNCGEYNSRGGQTSVNCNTDKNKGINEQSHKEIFLISYPAA